jgi:hypothetical protein
MTDALKRAAASRSPSRGDAKRLGGRLLAPEHLRQNRRWGKLRSTKASCGRSWPTAHWHWLCSPRQSGRPPRRDVRRRTARARRRAYPRIRSVRLIAHARRSAVTDDRRLPRGDSLARMEGHPLARLREDERQPSARGGRRRRLLRIARPFSRGDGIRIAVRPRRRCFHHRPTSLARGRYPAQRQSISCMSS